MNKVTETMISNVDKTFVIDVDSDITDGDRIEQVPETFRIKRNCNVESDFDVDEQSICISSTKRNDNLNTCTIDMNIENQHVQGLECSSFKRSGDMNNIKGRHLHTPEQYTRTKMYLQPVLFLLACGGCYNFNRIKGIENDTKQGRVKGVASFVYRTFVGITVLATLIKFIVGSFYITEESLVENGLSITWHTMCACHYLVHIKADSVRYGHRKKCFDSFDEILNDFNNMGITFPAAKVKRWMKRASIVGWSLVLANMSGNVLRGVFHDPTRDLYTAPIPEHQINWAPFRSNELFLVIFYFAEIFVTTVWMSSFVYIMAICYLFICAFDSFNACLKEAVKGKSVDMKDAKGGSQDGQSVEVSSVKVYSDVNSCKINIDRDILEDNQVEQTTSTDASSTEKSGNVNNIKSMYLTRNQKCTNRYIQDVHKLRLLHLKLCDLVADFDADMRWFFGSTCFLYLGLLCVCLFKLVKTPEIEAYTLMMYLFWMATGATILGLVTILAALVNEKAHAALDCIFHVDVIKTEPDQVTQITLFLSKLTGTQVGFTTCGLLTITKDFILSLTGTQVGFTTCGLLTITNDFILSTQISFTTCGLLTITKDFILPILGVFLTYFAVLYTL